MFNLDNFTTLKDVKVRLKEGRSPDGYVLGRTKPTLDRDSILIDPVAFLEGAGDMGLDEYCYHHIDDVDELAGMIGDFEYDFANHSANYGGYLQREISVKVFKNDDTGERLAAF